MTKVNHHQNYGHPSYYYKREESSFWCRLFTKKPVDPLQGINDTVCTDPQFGFDGWVKPQPSKQESSLPPPGDTSINSSESRKATVINGGDQLYALVGVITSLFVLCMGALCLVGVGYL